MMPSVLARFRPAPLSSSFFLASILGLLVVLFYFGDLAATRTGKSFALAFIIFFVLMFIASIISMRRAPTAAQLALDYHMTKAPREASPAHLSASQHRARSSKSDRSTIVKPAKRKLTRSRSRKRRRR